MTIVVIPEIRDLGTVPNNGMEESVYSATAEAFTGQMPGWGADNKAVAEAGRTNALHAAGAADSASSSASTANGRAEAASTSAATASTKAEEAAGSASSAAASLAAMQKLYLGNKAAHPSVDNQGAALQKGAWYTNSTNSYWYWWNGTSWIVGVGDLNAVDWATQVINKPMNLVTTDGAQTVTGAKTFTNPILVGGELHLAAGKAVKGWRSFSAALNSGNTSWITICNFAGSNKPMYSRFLLINSARHYFAEIVFSRTTADSLSSVAEIKLRGTYNYFPCYPSKFRIIDQGTNSSARLDMCFLGTGASTENFDIFVFEDYTAEDRSVSEYITYPFSASGAYPAASAPNAVTMIVSGGVSLLEARLNTAKTYTAIIYCDGSVGQVSTETSTAAAG